MNLEKLLKDRNISNAQFARWMGVSRAIVTFWVNGKRKPSYDSLLKICELLECSYEELLGEQSRTRLKIEHILDGMTEKQLKEVLKKINEV